MDQASRETAERIERGTPEDRTLSVAAIIAAGKADLVEAATVVADARFENTDGEYETWRLRHGDMGKLRAALIRHREAKP